MDRLLKLHEVCSITTLPKTKIYALIRTKEFPAQVKLGTGRRVAWRAWEIEAFVRSRPIVRPEVRVRVRRRSPVDS